MRPAALPNVTTGIDTEPCVSMPLSCVHTSSEWSRYVRPGASSTLSRRLAMSTNVDAKKRWYDCTSSACRSASCHWCATSWCQSPPYDTKRDVSPYASTPIRLVPHMNAAAATSFQSCSCFPASSGVLALCLLALSVGVVDAGARRAADHRGQLALQLGDARDVIVEALLVGRRQPLVALAQAVVVREHPVDDRRARRRARRSSARRSC